MPKPPSGPGVNAPPTAHPPTSAEIVLGSTRVAYRLRRSQRRSIGLQISAQGLTVSVPTRARLADIEHALRTKASWILSKLAQQRERAQEQHAAQPVWLDGTQLPCLGGSLTLRLLPGQRGAKGPQLPELAKLLGSHTDTTAAVFAATSALPELAQDGAMIAWVLHLGLPANATPVQMRDAAAVWLKRQALALFEQRIQLYAPRLGVAPTQLGLTNARTRWGSASASGAVRLNWRLVHFALPVIDYVVVHELAHLRHMNHGPAFWALVDTQVPDVAACRNALRHPALPHWE